MLRMTRSKSLVACLRVCVVAAAPFVLAIRAAALVHVASLPGQYMEIAADIEVVDGLA